MKKLTPDLLANAVKNYAEFNDAELRFAAKMGNSIAAEVLEERHRLATPNGIDRAEGEGWPTLS